MRFRILGRNMRFVKNEHKELLLELGYDPNHDYVTDDELADLWMNVTDHLQKEGFKYIGTEPVPTRIGLICEEVTDLLAEVEE